MKPGRLLRLEQARSVLGVSTLLSLCLLAVLVWQWQGVAKIVQALFLDGASLASQALPLLLLLMALVVRAVLAALREAYAASAAIRFKRTVRDGLTRRLLAFGPVLAAHEHGGERVTALYGGVEKLGPYHARFVPQALHAGIVGVGLAVLLLVLDPLSGLFLCLTGPLVLVFMWLIGSATQRAAEKQWATLGRLGAGFVDTLRGLAVLQAFGRVRGAEAVLAETNLRYRRTTMKLLRVAFLSGFVLELTATLSTALVAVTVGVRLFEGHLAFERALWVLLLTPEFFAPLRQLGADHHAGMEARAAADTLTPITTTPLPESGTARPAPGSPALSFAEVGLELSGQQILTDIDFQIPPGGRLALVGTSGSGKTSVLNVLLGFAPVSGEIRISGVPLHELELSAWRQQVALVSQQPFLLHASIRDNLLLAQPEATDADLYRVLRQARANFATELPEGLETNLGEGGARLSGGERAKLSLARALLKDAAVLLLDEPTAQLDPQAEAELRAALRQAMVGRTVVLATHRLEALADMDTVLVLQAGRVQEYTSAAAFTGEPGADEQVAGEPVAKEQIAREAA